MIKLMQGIVIVIILSCVLLIGFVIGGAVEAGSSRNNSRCSDNISCINTQDKNKVKLIAQCEDGTKVYRIEGEDMVVPAVLAVTPKGQVVFR